MEVSLPTGRSERALETVKILHETILALRTALEGSRNEIDRLRNDVQNGGNRQRILVAQMDETKTAESPQDENKLDSGAESDDIDDIELVFTTGETDPGSIHEDLVPILEEKSSTVVVETDISKCGVFDDSEMNLMARRNTLPNPLPYRPILHREVLGRLAPVRSPCKALLPGTQDAGAQTDITAVPSQWKSETYLAHKMSCNLTTLPSKFALPIPRVKRLPLSDKTREARRVLLSDINFTSMVPELSRSADHLHDEKTPKNGFGDAYHPCEYHRHDSRSNCGSCYVSSTSSPPFESRRRHSWKPQRVVCCHGRYHWSSVPSSPVKCAHEPEDGCCCHVLSRKRRTRVHFHNSCDPCGRSLPNLRVEGDSGESTDSLLDEAEEFLRRSIDNMIVSKTAFRRRERTTSDTDSVSSFEPPKSSQPFLPKTVEDLKSDCFVKVIMPGGRIAVGKVKHAGMIPGKAEPYVGVELANDTGFSDGCFLGHRFFQCGTNHAVFVPFRKVVIAWDI